MLVQEWLIYCLGNYSKDRLPSRLDILVSHCYQLFKGRKDLLLDGIKFRVLDNIFIGFDEFILRRIVTQFIPL
jgi:hypothetical protein